MRRRTAPHRAIRSIAALIIGTVGSLPAGGLEGAADHDGSGSHLLISEVMPGGASASDEFMELYNPGQVALPLEGLELVYVTASGATVSRRAAWEVGAPFVPPGGHVLVANEAGIFAAIGDALYASGLSATGGSVALRIIGAVGPIDAVGWGSASSAWMEGSPAAAPPAGSSLERLPGGSAGSGQDTGNNAVDFVVSGVPDPQNLSSPSVPDPDATPAPSTAPTPGSTPPGSPPLTPPPVPSATAMPTPSSSATPIAIARGLPDGARVTVRGVALTDSAFSDGGGYLDDGSAGIAVLLSGGSFARGDLVEVRGEIDDRFHQRTLRVAGSDLSIVGSGTDPTPRAMSPGQVGESVEGRLVRIAGTVAGKPSQLAAGLAFDLRDEGGTARVIVGGGLGISTAGWVTGATVELVGVVGQRDSTGGGTAGYRVQPRRAADVLKVVPPAVATPSPSAGSSVPPAASPGSEPLITIAQARAAEPGARLRVRGVVTLPSGVVDRGSAVIQDASGGILLRLGAEAGGLRLGELVEATGRRATKAGMATLQVTTPPGRPGSQAAPGPMRLQTGRAGEAHEARLIVVRGALVANGRRAASGTVSFQIDDGSGPLRVYAGSTLGLGTDALRAGTWVEATGVLGQETSGSEPLSGYRVWLRGGADLVILAGATGGSPPGVGDDVEGAGGEAGGPAATLEQLLDGTVDGAAPVEATLVSGPWSQIGVAGLLWDGRRLVALEDDSATRTHVESLPGSAAPPLAVLLSGARASGLHPLGIPLLQADTTASLSAGAHRVAAPDVRIPTAGAAWVELAGRLPAQRSGGASMSTVDGPLTVETPCDGAPLEGVTGIVELTGIGLASPPRLVARCDGLELAPILATADGRAGVGVSAAAGAATTPEPAVDPGSGSVLPAALLGGAAALLALAAGWLEWQRRRASDAHQPTDGAPAPQPGLVDPGAEPPRLSLVSLPRERGSP